MTGPGPPDPAERAPLDAARTIADLSRRNAQLAVLARVAELAGEATELPAFFSRASDVLRPVAGYAGLALFVVDEGAGELVRIHSEGGTPALVAGSERMPLASPLGDVVRERIARVAPVPVPGAAGILEALPFRSLAWVPLVARSRGVGVLAAGFDAGTEAAAAAVDLLSAAGAHFASAIESHSLLGDLRRRVGELTLLVDVARASTQLDPVLLLEGALRRVCATVGAQVAAAFLRDGDRLLLLTSVGLDPACAEALARIGAAEGAPGEAIARRAAVRADGTSAFGARVPHRCVDGPVIAVPLLAKADAAGALVFGRSGKEPYSDGDVALLGSIGAQLGMAVDAARLFADVRRRLSDLEAVHALTLRVFANAPGDAGALLRDACRELTGALSARAAAVFLTSPAESTLRLAASVGLPEKPGGLAVDLRLDSLSAEVIRTRQPLQTEDMTLDPRSQLFGRGDVPHLALLAVPLVARGHVRGVVYVGDEPGHRFGAGEIAVANALAGALGIGVENAELYADLRRSYAQLARAQQQVVQGERLAALGELSAIVAHEVRNPLGVIFNSLGSLRRLVRPAGDARMLFDIVEEEADRLNRIVGDLLDFARPSTPELRPELLGRVVEDAVGAAVAQQAGRIELVRELDPALPPVAMDARLVRQAVLNVAVNAVQAMPRGGRITVRARREGDGAVVEIEDTGAGIPDEVRERIFEPFFTTKASGTGLGLAVVRRIVEGHGGEVRVRSVAGAGTTFTLIFPLHPDSGAVENDPVMR